jgi:hypothetical protein
MKINKNEKTPTPTWSRNYLPYRNETHSAGNQ